MRILIMDAGRGTRGPKVALWREKLGLAADDDVALLTWQAPAEPLPVVAHLVAGPALHLGREPRAQLVAGQAGAAIAQAGRAGRGRPGGLEARIEAAESTVLADEPSEQFADADALAVTDIERAPRVGDDVGAEVDGGPGGAQGAGGTGGADGAGGPGGADGAGDDSPDTSPGLGDLPRRHPRRLAHGLRWRGNRLRRQTRRRYRRGRAQVAAVGELPSRAVRSVLRLRGSGVPNEFALAVWGSKEAARLFAGADVVVPVDELSQRAAWVLAQRVEGPDVVVTFHAATRVIARRRAAG